MHRLIVAALFLVSCSRQTVTTTTSNHQDGAPAVSASAAQLRPPVTALAVCTQIAERVHSTCQATERERDDEDNAQWGAWQGKGSKSGGAVFHCTTDAHYRGLNEEIALFTDPAARVFRSPRARVVVIAAPGASPPSDVLSAIVDGL